MEKQKRLSVKEASAILDINPETLRRGISSGKLPIGSAIPSESGERERFLIYKSKLKAYLENKESKETVDTSYKLIKEAYRQIEDVYFMLKEVIED